MPVYLCVIFCMCCRERVVEMRFDSRCSSFQAEPAEGEEGPASSSKYQRQFDILFSGLFPLCMRVFLLPGLSPLILILILMFVVAVIISITFTVFALTLNTTTVLALRLRVPLLS